MFLFKILKSFAKSHKLYTRQTSFTKIKESNDKSEKIFHTMKKWGVKLLNLLQKWLKRSLTPNLNYCPQKKTHNGRHLCLTSIIFDNNMYLVIIISQEVKLLSTIFRIRC